MRQIIQIISLTIVIFLGLVLSALDNLPMSGATVTITSIITMLYILVFLLIAIDPNMIRILMFGPFGPYVSLLVAIIVLLLTYLFLIPAIAYYLSHGGIPTGIS